MTQLPSSPGGFQWRSEEDYFIARLAVSMGILDPSQVETCLHMQDSALQGGQSLSLSQILVREQLPPDALLRIKSELMRCHHTCVSCGGGRYLAPGPQARVEPCPRCGGEIHVPPAGSSLTNSRVVMREEALNISGSARFTKDPLAQSGSGPRLFGNYILDAELARGGMGAVYRVRHAETGQVFALKVLLAGENASEKQLHRFRRESKAQLELDHPNIVKIHDAGEWEGILYYAMDLIEGRDLDAFAEFSLNKRLEMLSKVCRAIHYAHEQGYLHRDLKPANVLLDERNEPLLTDFGLAKNIDGNTMLTQEGAIMGTPFYMSPEQATGQTQQIGPGSDIFSLGVLLYQFATEQLPFSGDSAIELYRNILESTPASFADHGVMAPELEAVAFKAMRKDPELRYSSAGELADDIDRCMRGESPHASSVGSAERALRQVEKHKRSIGFILGMVGTGVVLLLGLTLGLRAGLEGHARGQREKDVSHAVLGISEALQGLESMPLAEATRSLDAALEAADQALSAEGPEPSNLGELRAKRSAGLLARADVGLRAGDGTGARVALTALEAAWPDLADDERARAHALKARASWRLGEDEQAAAQLDALAKLAPDDPRVVLLRAVQARLAGEHERVLELLSSGGAGSAGHLERARALLALGREEEAQTPLKAALDAGPPARVHALCAETLLARGQLAAAAEAYERALELAPGDLGLARRLLAAHLGCGQPLRAAAALQRARGRNPGVPQLDALWLHARLRAGEDVETKLAELGEIEDAALVLGGLRRARREAPGVELAEPSDAARVTLARWQVEQGGAVILESLPHLLDAAPHDRPPSPGLARGLRDLGWTYKATGDTDRARACAQAAIRGLPGDVDVAALLALVDPEAGSSQLQAAFTVATRSLDGALARGLFLGRLARYHGDAALNERAVRLLQSHVADHPQVYPALVELAALHKGEAGRKVDEGVDWGALVPPIPPRPKLTKAQTKQVARLLEQAQKLPRLRNQEAIDLCHEALKIDPTSFDLRKELASRVAREHGRIPKNRLLFAEALRCRPMWAFDYLLEYFGDWKSDYMFGTLAEPREAAKKLLAEDASIPLHHIPWIVDRYFGLIYPDQKKPSWTPGTPVDEILPRIDWILGQDPLLAGFLYMRAHLHALGERYEQAKRDVDLATTLGHLGWKANQVHWEWWDMLYRVWIHAGRPEGFKWLQALLDHPISGSNTAAHYLGEGSIGDIKTSFGVAAHMASMREDPRFAAWERGFKPVPLAERPKTQKKKKKKP